MQFFDYKESSMTMVKRFLIIATIIGLLTSCPDPASNHPKQKPANPQDTAIVFDNTHGISPASVFTDYRRREEDKLVAVPSGDVSEKFGWTPAASVPFYFSYSVNWKGINGFVLNYVPREIGKDQKTVRVDEGVTTTVNIPRLDETVSSSEDPFSDKCYLLIQNNSSFPFKLVRGETSIIPSDNFSDSLINSGDRAQYTINPGAASPYQLLVGADFISFSGSIVSFDAGRLYSFIFDGAVTLITELELKLGNAAGLIPGDAHLAAPLAPVVTEGDGLLTLRWTAVQGAENYEAYLSETRQPPALPEKTVMGTTAVFSGLTNKTPYYMWIKAVNSLTASEFSPSGLGIPWPFGEIPAAPEKLVIVPGIGQLAVSWEQCGGADSYEVFINTTAARLPAYEIATDKTGAVIENLENNQIYYIWVRSVNGFGESEFSPPESGTPKVPTSIPSAPSRPAVTAGSREIKLSWNAVELAGSYEVWLGTSDNSAQAQKYGDDIPNGITETVISGLANETVYYAWLKANNIIGTSGFSPAVSAKPSAFIVLPETPSQPAATPGTRSLNISWPAVEGALSYELWMGQTNNQAGAEKKGGDITGTAVTLNSLTNDATYYIWIKAKNNLGVSGLSPIASGTPSAYAATPPVPQDAPSVIAGSGQLTLSWQAVEGAESYEVWAGTSTNPVIATKSRDGVEVLSAVITGLTNGTQYYVWIKAKNSVGVSNFSPMATGTPSAFNDRPRSPSVPSITTGNGQINITWTAVEGATSYEVWLGNDNNTASAVKNGSDVTTSLSASVYGLTNGTAYYVWIKAKNNIGASGFSPAANGKPIANATVPTVTASSGQLAVTWTAIAGADQYDVFCGTGINPPAGAAQTVTATSAAIGGLVNGTTYNVWVRGKNATGTGATSPAASARPVGNMGTVALISGNGQLTANWTAVAGAEQYEVYYNNSDSIPDSSAQTVSTTTVTITGLTNGSTYYVWIKPKNANGAGNVNTVVSGVPMATPGSLMVGAGNQEITISWSAVPGASSYDIYYSATASIPAAPSFTKVTELNKTITGLNNGTTYNFWVKAVNANGTSGASPMASGKPIGNMGAVTLVLGNGQLTANWTAVAGADEYYVYYNTSNSIPASASQTVTTNTVTITGLTNGTTYYVWVKPKNANGAGNVSAAVSGKPLGNMGTVTLVLGNGQITASWSAVTGAEQYEVYYRTTNSIPASPSQTVSTTTATISGLTNGTTYYVWVKGKNTTGTGSVSAVVSAKPIGDIGTVTLVSGNGQLTASWTAAVGADQYEVYRNTSDSIPASPSQTVSTTTVTMSSLTNGTTYYVWVKGKNTTGTSNASTVVSGKPIAVPGAPILSPGPKLLQVTWTQAAGADEYEVYYGTSSTPTTLAATTAGTTAIISGLTNGTTYYVRLRAKNANGVSGYGPDANQAAGGTPGLYRGAVKIGTQNLADSLTYISSNAVTGDEFFIVLGADESSSPQTLSYSGKTVGVTLLGYGSERKITRSGDGTLFTVNSGVTFTLDENITLVGRSTNTGGIVYLSGNLIINNGAKITGGKASNGGGVKISSSGTLTMNGGEISGNTATGDNNNFFGGGGVSCSGTFTMTGGQISDNSFSGGTIQNGGGVYLRNGSFTMSGNAIISGNNALNSGGVHVDENGTFIMSENAVISGNTSNNIGGGGAGGVALSGTNASFTMQGGKISGNTAYNSGGGVYVTTNGTFTMNGGEISGNTASYYGGGVYVTTNGTFTMSGGTISGNTASAYGGGVYVSGGTFTKSGGGTITGYASDTVNGNVVKYSSGVVQNNQGHAVYVDNSPVKRRETTAGPTVNLDSSVFGTAGGWELNPVTLTTNNWADGNIPTSNGDQWFKFTATASTQYIHVSFGTLTDLYVNVYDSSGTAVGSQRYLYGSTKYDSRTVTGGQEYYIRVWPSNSSGSGTYKIAINTTLNPPGTTTTSLTDNTWADGNITTSGGDQWFKFTATASTQYIHAGFGTLNYLYVQVYDSSGTTVGSQTSLSSSTRYTSLTVTSGQEYYIRVWPYNSSGSGTYRIAFNTSTTPPP